MEENRLEEVFGKSIDTFSDLRQAVVAVINENEQLRLENKILRAQLDNALELVDSKEEKLKLEKSRVSVLQRKIGR
jgi:regulator of replication initiation timing